MKAIRGRRSGMTVRALVPWLAVAWLVCAAHGALADGPWEGFWETYSFGDDAYLSLRQDGETVTGAYFPYDGRIEGTARNGVLRGTWRSPNGTGTLVFTLTPDGRQFSGFVGSGEWWNGRRIDEDDIDALRVELDSPSHTIRSFMAAGRALRSGRITGLQAMFSALHFEREAAFADKSRRAQLLHDALSLTTFRVFEVRPSASIAGGEEPGAFAHEFRQTGTDEALTLVFRRDVFGLWRIDAPDADYLGGKLGQLLAARGLRELDPARYRTLASPRHTMEAFIAGMERWHVGGAPLVRETFDLSAVNERLRERRLPILAAFLAGNLNRMGRLTLQELPDDPESAKPFTYYQHPAGDVVIAPVVDSDGTRRWQFTAATLASAQRLHDALRTVPVTFDNVPNPQAGSAYFTARALAYGWSPKLTQVWGGIELWQWIGLLVLAIALPIALHLAARAVERRLQGDTHPTLLRKPVSLVVRLLVLGGLWLSASVVLGLPDPLSGPLHALGWVLVILGIAAQLYLVVNAATRALQTITRKTQTTMDDVAVALLSGLLKILLVVGAAVAIADVLGMPFETVLAGVGISGLAFAIASRDLLANLFGSAIIAADRPFKRGDFVSVGGIQGTVENVGLRSTRLRPVDDTTVMIPNSLISTDQVINISSRRHIRVPETIHIDHDASVDELRELRERIRDALLADAMVFEENVCVGLATISLYAVEMEISFFVKTTSYDAYLYEKHRLLAYVLSIIEGAGVKRAVIRKE